MERSAENETKKKRKEEPQRQFILGSEFRWRAGMHSQATLNALSHTNTHTDADTQKPWSLNALQADHVTLTG